MKHPIGFCVQPRAPEAASPTPAAQPEAAAVPSVVRVYFPERDRAYSYYNDRFDLHEGDVVYVSGKLAGLLGRVAAVDYNFRIRLADYERVIGAADQEPCAARFTCSARTCSRSITARCRMRRCAAGFSRRRRTGSLSPATAPDRRTRWTFSIRCPCRRDRRQGTRLLCRGAGGLPVGRRHAGAHHRAGHGAARAHVHLHGGTVSALTCTCYETGLCKHGAALLLQLRETVDFLREEHEEAFAASDRFAAVSKHVFSHFAMDGSAGGCITLT